MNDNIKIIKLREKQIKDLHEQLFIEKRHTLQLQQDVDRFVQVNQMLIKELKGYVEEKEERKKQEVPTFKQRFLIFNVLIFYVYSER